MSSNSQECILTKSGFKLIIYIEMAGITGRQGHRHCSGALRVVLQPYQFSVRCHMPGCIIRIISRATEDLHHRVLIAVLLDIAIAMFGNVILAGNRDL
jgi:hypothetical protein